MISTFPAQGSTGFQSFLRCSVQLKITCWKHFVSRIALPGSSKPGMVKRTHPKICSYKILLTLRMKIMYTAETQIWITTPQFFITQFVEQTLKQMPFVRVPEFVFGLNFQLFQLRLQLRRSLSVLSAILLNCHASQRNCPLPIYFEMFITRIC